MTAPLDDIDISICIANYNGAGILMACLRSIDSQETCARYEIIIHDDASTDGSLDETLKEFPGAHLIRSTENVGYCVSNQRMAREASGKYLLLLNNDTELMPGAIEALFRASSELPESVLSLREYTMGDKLSSCGMGLDIFFRSFRLLEENGKIAFAMGACLMLPKARWFELGGYPEFFEIMAEDLYICLRARAIGIPTRIVKKSGYRHHVGATTNPGGVNVTRWLISKRNALYIVNHALVLREKLFLWPLFQLMSLLEMMVHSLRFRRYIPFKISNLPPHPVAAKLSILPIVSWRIAALERRRYKTRLAEGKKPVNR